MATIPIYGVLLKMLCTPLYPMVLLIIIPFSNGYIIGNIPNIFRQTHNYSQWANGFINELTTEGLAFGTLGEIWGNDMLGPRNYSCSRKVILQSYTIQDASKMALSTNHLLSSIGVFENSNILCMRR